MNRVLLDTSAYSTFMKGNPEALVTEDAHYQQIAQIAVHHLAGFNP